MHEFALTLKKVPLFSDLPVDEINEIASCFELLKVSKNQVILNVNEQGKYLYIIKYGQVRITVPSQFEDGEEVVAVLGAGSYFGEMSLLTGEPVSATVTASLDSEFLILDKKEFNSLLKKYSRLTYNLSMILSKRLRERNISRQTKTLPQKVSVFALNDSDVAEKIIFLLGISLFIEGMNRILLVCFGCMPDDKLVSMGFAPAKDKMNHYISTHDIGKDLEQIDGDLYEYSNLEKFLKWAKRKNTDIKSPYSGVNGDKEEYKYMPGIFILRIKNKNTGGSIKREQIPPLLGLLSQIYDSILICLGEDTNDVTAKALSQSDLNIFACDKSRDKVIQLRGALKDLCLLDECNITNSKLAFFQPDFNTSISFAEIGKIFEADSLQTSNLAVTAKEFKKVSVSIDSGIYSKRVFKAVSGIARDITGNTVGLALGGGGARGYAHIGVLKALDEIEFPIDVISGSSMGSLIGAVYCMTGCAKETEKILRKELAESGNIFDFTLPVNSFLKGNRIKKIASNIFKDKTFSDMLIPFYVVCVDLITGQEIVIKDGLVKLAVQASSAIPAIFKPVRWKDKYLVDGSVINKVPANILNRLKTDIIISVNVTPDRETFMETKFDNRNVIGGILRKVNIIREFLDEPNILQIINRSLNITNTQMSKSGSHFTNFEIKPDIEKFDFLNFKNFAPIVTAGEEATRKCFKELEAILYRV